MKTVGVFDSGVGGLSVLRALLSELPGTRFVYVADSAHAPYGERTASEVSARTHRIAAHLRETHAIDALVLACNTATAQAIDSLRERNPDLPVIGVEPALKPAAISSRSGHIGVLATRGTLDSARFAQLRERQLAGATRALQFSCQPCDGLADAIERHDTPAILALSERNLHALREQAGPDMDTLVLGCTHYPFAADVLSHLCGPSVVLMDTGMPVARRTREVLGESSTDTGSASPPVLASTGSPEALMQAARRWLNIHSAAQALQA
ncbi:MAG: glutamate racemase [Hydrogenophaga sp.]|uniref:glutamate racemase n=1 Tax=Hydrogenophaga sp. TaxID=1904254 RepID=UPI003D1165F6